MQDDKLKEIIQAVLDGKELQCAYGFKSEGGII